MSSLEQKLSNEQIEKLYQDWKEIKCIRKKDRTLEQHAIHKQIKNHRTRCCISKNYDNYKKQVVSKYHLNKSPQHKEEAAKIEEIKEIIHAKQPELKLPKTMKLEQWECIKCLIEETNFTIESIEVSFNVKGKST